MLSFKIIFVSILSFCIINFVNCISQYPIVLIVSYDGFRFNYYDKGATPFLGELRKNGTYAEYLNNVFITKTYPNHHSIATGVYPETHGVMGNFFYDPLYKKPINYSREMWNYSDEVIPIWIANEMKGKGRYSGVMMWPGNNFEYAGRTPTHQRTFNHNVKWEERVDGVIDWLLHPQKPANLVLLYIEEPDSHAHAFGPESEQIAKELSSMDHITQYLLDKLTTKNLLDKVNLFFVSDHGMQSVTKKDIIDLSQYVPDVYYDKYEYSPIYHIYPKENQEEYVYNQLKKAADAGAHFKVYKKAEIPTRWHYKNNRRTPPILAVADPPYVFQDFYNTISEQEKKWNFTADDNAQFGVHGYDNNVPNMKPHFIALGPLIKKDYKIQPFETVDLYSLWANIAGFPEYALKTNGSFERVKGILKSPDVPPARERNEILIDDSTEKGNDINAYYERDMGRELFKEQMNFQFELNVNDFKKLKQRYTLICKLLKTVHEGDKCSSYIQLFEDRENESNSL